MTRILGVDPGSLITGYGFVDVEHPVPRPVLHGTLKPGRGLDLADRLLTIHRDLSALLAEHAPDVVVVETAFYHKNVRSTLVLGHVRGVVLLAAREAGIPVAEYAPREIKLTVTGNGGAAKEQVSRMVQGLLKLSEPPLPDAADALAVALCHWNRARIKAPG
jgi:crossover junction endodeoxyribonuclease RuvC